MKIYEQSLLDSLNLVKDLNSFLEELRDCDEFVCIRTNSFSDVYCRVKTERLKELVELELRDHIEYLRKELNEIKL